MCGPSALITAPSLPWLHSIDERQQKEGSQSKRNCTYLTMCHPQNSAPGVYIKASPYFLGKEPKLSKVSDMLGVTKITGNRGSAKTQVSDYESKGLQYITSWHTSSYIQFYSVSWQSRLYWFLCCYISSISKENFLTKARRTWKGKRTKFINS